MNQSHQQQLNQFEAEREMPIKLTKCFDEFSCDRSIISHKSSLSLQKNSVKTKSIIDTVNSYHEQQSDIIHLTEVPTFNQTEQTDPNSQRIIQQHKQFLNNYKKQREKQLINLRTTEEDKQSTSSQQQQVHERRRCSSMMQQSQQQNEEHSLNIDYVKNRMHHIHNKINKAILTREENSQKPRFKLFLDVVENKNDIGRVVKQRRFIKSQQSKYYEYREPEMGSKDKVPKQFRVKTQAIYDQGELTKKAKQFVERVHKEQQNLLGKHMMRKKLDEIKRTTEQRQEVRKFTEINQLKRQQRKLKAEQQLMLMKEKVKISQLINRRNLEELNALMGKHEVNEDRINIRRSTQCNSQNQTDAYHRFHKRRETSENSEDNDNEKKWRYKQLKMATDRLNKIKQPDLKLRDKIAKKKLKMPKPRIVEYHEENQFNKQKIIEQNTKKQQKSHRSSLFDQEQLFKEINYPNSDQFCEQGIDGQQIKQKQRQEINTYTQYKQRQIPVLNNESKRQSKLQRDRRTPSSSLQ